jgi:protein-tyrosine-phosphatase
MAEAILNRAGQGNCRAFSAGSQPKGQVHPYTLDLLRKMHFDVSGACSKSWLDRSIESLRRRVKFFESRLRQSGEVPW